VADLEAEIADLGGEVSRLASLVTQLEGEKVRERVR